MQQRAMLLLRTSLSIEMRSVLHLAIGIENDDDISVLEILDQIHEYVRAKRNVTLDRVALEERKQEDGEPFDQFYIDLREIANRLRPCVRPVLTIDSRPESCPEFETRKPDASCSCTRPHLLYRQQSISVGVRSPLVKMTRLWREAGRSTPTSTTFARKRDHAEMSKKIHPPT